MSPYQRKPYQWLPKTLDRILEPFLGKSDGEVRDAVEEAMERISVDPTNPGLPTVAWKGTDVRNGRVTKIMGGRILLHYIVHADMPWIALRSIVDLKDERSD